MMFSVRVRVTLWVAVYHQSVCLGVKPLEAHKESPPPTEPFRSYSLCKILFDKGMVFSLINILTICQEYISHIWHDIENSSFYNIYKSSVIPGFAEQIMPILFIVCYNGSLVTWTVVSLTAAKLKPLIFSVSAFALSYATNMFILMILRGLCLLPA
jgi:hypothetical protein